MKREGFTLIELMIVVAIIAIIAAIAIPSLLTAKKSGHEAAIIASLRTISSTQEQYRTRFGTYGTLAQLSGAGFIDAVLGSGSKSGYYIETTGVTSTAWACRAKPVTQGSTGDRSFWVDESGVIRFEADGTNYPTVASSALDN